MVSLIQMTESEFASWKELAIEDYAKDRARAGNDAVDGAVERSRREFESILPEGLKTKENHLFSVTDDSGQRVGMLWLGSAPGRRTDVLWIYDIRMHEDQRGKGYGTAVLALAEEKARELGKTRIGLHVFAHNEGARRLYERLGYRATNISMAKDL